MSRLTILVFTVFFSIAGIAQSVTISGTINNNGVRQAELLLLTADHEYEIGATQVPLAADGSFKRSIGLAYPLFAILKIGDRRQKLLLSPGRHLSLQIDAGPQAVTFAGSGAVENRLMQITVLTGRPFFITDDKNPYHAITVQGFHDSLLARINSEIAGFKATVQKTNIPAGLQKLLISEMTYAYQCYLTDFTLNDMRFHKNPNYDTLTTLAVKWQPMPRSEELQSGFYANMVMGRHEWFGFNQVFRNKTGGRAAMEARVSEYVHTPFAVVDSLVRNIGEAPVQRWLYAKHHLPADIAEKVLFNSVMAQADLACITGSEFALQRLQEEYPRSAYLATAQKVVKEITAAVRLNENNERIRYRNAASITSLNDLVKPYAGKVIYLDIWGTWCGPCKQEMRYVQDLKKRFAGKDVVFLYLAADRKEVEEEWKKYIRFANLEGDHYMMDRNRITPIWDDLQKAGAARLHTYPTYVLFDKQGKLVTPEAERPSSKEKLYAQLDKLL